MTEDRRPDEEVLWVLRAQTGDRDALESLLIRIGGPLLRYVSSIVTHRASAEDVLQESFVRIWRNIGWLREPELFRPWAFRIASREAFRSLGRSRRWNERTDVRELDVFSAFEAPRLDPEMRAKLANMVNALSPASRAVITLVYYEDFTLAEAAAVLDVPPGTVRSRLAYGLARLREQMAAPGDRGKAEP